MKKRTQKTLAPTREKLLVKSLKEVTDLLEEFVRFGESIAIGKTAYAKQRRAIENARFLITSSGANDAMVEFKNG